MEVLRYFFKSDLESVARPKAAKKQLGVQDKGDAVLNLKRSFLMISSQDLVLL